MQFHLAVMIQYPGDFDFHQIKENSKFWTSSFQNAFSFIKFTHRLNHLPDSLKQRHHTHAYATPHIDYENVHLPPALFTLLFLKEYLSHAKLIHLPSPFYHAHTYSIKLFEDSFLHCVFSVYHVSRIKF